MLSQYMLLFCVFLIILGMLTLQGGTWIFCGIVGSFFSLLVLVLDISEIETDNFLLYTAVGTILLNVSTTALAAYDMLTS